MGRKKINSLHGQENEKDWYEKHKELGCNWVTDSKGNLYCLVCGDAKLD